MNSPSAQYRLDLQETSKKAHRFVFLKSKNINALYILGIQMKYSKNMVIGIDLNWVLRDLNKQINVCWEKKHGTPYIEDENDVKNHDLKSEIKWNSIQERNEFFFEEYPFELFGCTPCMSNYCVFKVNDWYKESENFAKAEPIEFVLVSPFEYDTSIMGTLFFCSKYLKLRYFFFPKKSEDIWNSVDVLISANDKLAQEKPEGKILMCINNPINKTCQQKADFKYDTIEELIDDNWKFDKIWDLYVSKSPIWNS